MKCNKLGLYCFGLHNSSSFKASLLTCVHERLLYKTVLSFACIVCSFSLFANKSDTTRILFIGNSYTYAGMGEQNPEIPFRLKEMGALYKKNIQTGFIVKGGAQLEQHWKDGKALHMIQNGHYNFVVLQDQSSAAFRSLNSFREYAVKFDSAIKRSSAKTVLYMTWGYSDRPKMVDTIAYEYNRLGKDLGAIVAPCGLAWKSFFEKNPNIELHISDKSHPRTEGVYLNTCVFYQTLFGKIPTKTLYTIKNKNVTIDGDLATKLQAAAKEAMVLNADYGKEQRLNQNPYFQSPTADINQVIIYGQSLSTGQQTAPVISVKNYAGNLMLGEQLWSNFSNNLDTANLVFKPLIGRPAITYKKTNKDVFADTSVNANSQTNCEPPVLGFVNAAKYYFDQSFKGFSERKFAAMSSGEGGRSIELLMKDCPNRPIKLYNHFVKAIQKSKEAADRMNKTINCSAILWMQGEYNYTTATNQGWLPNTPATKYKNEYKKYFSTLVTDMISDVATTYQQFQKPIFITYQCGAQYTRDFEVPVGMAQLELANSDPRIVMAGPVYPVTDRGGHLCPNGSRWYGEMMAKVYYKTVIKGEKWKPLQPKEITKGNDFIDIDFYVQQPPLRLDTLTLQKAANYGFQVRQSGQTKTIIAVTIVSPTKLRLTVDAAFSDSTLEINYAGPATRGNGNLCDSDDFTSFETYKELVAGGSTDAEKNRFKPKYEPLDKDGKIIYNQHYPMQNFSCAFYYAIPATATVIKM